VSDALDRGDAAALTFDATDVLARVEQVGDLYAANLATEQRLPVLGNG
jgi:hypothetical protein